MLGSGAICDRFVAPRKPHVMQACGVGHRQGHPAASEPSGPDLRDVREGLSVLYLRQVAEAVLFQKRDREPVTCVHCIVLGERGAARNAEDSDTRQYGGELLDGGGLGHGNHPLW